MTYLKVNNVELNIEHFSSLSKEEFVKQASRDLSQPEVEFAYNKIQEFKTVSNDNKGISTSSKKHKPANGNSGGNQGK